MSALTAGMSAYDVAMLLGGMIVFVMLFNEEISEFMTRK
jgi:hypothetical protein